MTNYRTLLLGACLAMLPWSAAVAKERIVDGKPCNEFCQAWLGIRASDGAPTRAAASGHGSPTWKDPGAGTGPVHQVSSVQPLPMASFLAAGPSRPPRAVRTQQLGLGPPQEIPGRPLAPEEDVGPPQPSRLVAVRGVVIAETPAERAIREKQRLSMEQETTVEGLTHRPVRLLDGGVVP